MGDFQGFVGNCWPFTHSIGMCVDAKVAKNLHTLEQGRNKNLGINPAFCDAASSLDNFVINPVYYATDVYAIEKKAANGLYDSVEKVVDAFVALEV